MKRKWIRSSYFAAASLGIFACSSDPDPTEDPGPTGVDEVAPLYSAGANWNDYVSKADTSAACPDAATSYKKCIHGGERLSAAVMGVTECTGLTASDDLGAFSWSCVEADGEVTVQSTGLSPDKGLSDLIGFGAVAWKENSVTVTNGTQSASSTQDVWWSNPVVEDNDGGTLNTSGTIYLVTSNATAAYTMGANRTALVVKPGNELLGADSAGTVISALNRKYLWVEGFVDAAEDNLGIGFDTVSFSRVPNRRWYRP